MVNVMKISGNVRKADLQLMSAQTTVFKFIMSGFVFVSV